MNEAMIENGAARIAAGKWLMGLAQPAACRGVSLQRVQKGFFVRDRAAVRVVETSGEAWCAAADRPFLTHLTALPDEPLHLVSAKLLVAPQTAKVGARAVKLVPMSFRRATVVTDFKLGWAVAATKSRVTRVSLADGDTLTVRPEALVAWIGKDPTGFCPRLTVLDILLPRGPKNLAYTFHGPATVWFEGSENRNLRPVPAHRIYT